MFSLSLLHPFLRHHGFLSHSLVPLLPSSVSLSSFKPPLCLCQERSLVFFLLTHSIFFLSSSAQPSASTSTFRFVLSSTREGVLTSMLVLSELLSECSLGASCHVNSNRFCCCLLSFEQQKMRAFPYIIPFLFYPD